MASKTKKSKAQRAREAAAENRRKLAEKQQRCFDLYEQGWKQIRISEELEVPLYSINRWLKNSGKLRPRNKRDEVEDTQEPFAANLESVTSETVTNERIAARDAEQQTLLEVAENQSSPADKYQAYVAASAIKMLRDNLMNVRGPRTVRELSELDQLIRRNLGLNPKGGSGSAASLTIDISILNNAKAANGGADVVVDAEEV